MDSMPGPERPETSSPRDSIPGAALSVGLAVFISRILGLVREMVLARWFGAGLQTDAFNIAYRVPNLLRDLFAEGALSSALVPAFIRTMTREGKAQAWLLANRVLGALAVIVGAVVLLVFFGARGFVYLLAFGYAATPDKFDLTVQMTRIMAPFLLCVSFASVGMGLLNACGRFFVPAMASSAFNLCCILAGIFLSPFMPRFGLDPVVSMAVGALAGGASQFVVMIPSAHALGFRFRLLVDFSDPGVRHICKRMVPAIAGLSATQVHVVVDSQIASMYGDGPVSWLNYGFRLIQFPLGVFGIAIAAGTLATASRYAALRAGDEVRRSVDEALRLAACLTFPAMVGLILFRREIVGLLYEGGRFLPEHTLVTGQVVALYALGLFSFSAVKIAVPVFYALDDARTPVRIGGIGVAAKIALNFACMIPLGFLGLPLATSLASWLQFGLLVRRLPRREGVSPGRRGIGGYARILVASLGMGACALAVFHAAGLWLDAAPRGRDMRLGLAILAGLFSYFPLLGVLRVPEANVLVSTAAAWIRLKR